MEKRMHFYLATCVLLLSSFGKLARLPWIVWPHGYLWCPKGQHSYWTQLRRYTVSSLFSSVSTLALNADNWWDLVVLGKQLTATHPRGVRNAIGSRAVPGPDAGWTISKGMRSLPLLEPINMEISSPINIWQINITKIIEVWLNIGPFDLIGWARQGWNRLHIMQGKLSIRIFYRR